MTRRQMHQLDAPGNAATISALVLALRIWVCSPMARAGRFYISRRGLGPWTVRIDEYRHATSLGYNFAQQF